MRRGSSLASHPLEPRAQFVLVRSPVPDRDAFPESARALRNLDPARVEIALDLVELLAKRQLRRSVQGFARHAGRDRQKLLVVDLRAEVDRLGWAAEGADHERERRAQAADDPTPQQALVARDAFADLVDNAVEASRQSGIQLIERH
jgi:hypothetical protein